MTFVRLWCAAWQVRQLAANERTQKSLQMRSSPPTADTSTRTESGCSVLLCNYTINAQCIQRLFSRFVLVFSNTERYIDDVVRGFVSTSSEPSIVRETPATALVDGTHVPFAFAIMLMDEPKSDNLLCNSELLRSELYKTELDLECMHRKQRRGSRGGKFCNATRHPESLKNKIIPIYYSTN